MPSLNEQIAVALFAAHFLGDFIFQTKDDILSKNQIVTFLKHIFIITLLSYLFTGLWNSWILPTAVLISHSIIDIIKLKINKDSIKSFFTDQFFHFLVIILLAFYLSDRLKDELNSIFWVEKFGGIYLKILALIITIVIITQFSSIIISYLIKPYQPNNINTTKLEDGLEYNTNEEIKAGRMIGILERLIILILYLGNTAIGIGFLITAKSILRFSEIKEESNDRIRYQIEYVLIGTLMSFAFGIVAAIGMKYYLERFNF